MDSGANFLAHKTRWPAIHILLEHRDVFQKTRSPVVDDLITALSNCIGNLDFVEIDLVGFDRNSED